MSRGSGVTLVHPSDTRVKVRCTANKRFALAVAVSTPADQPCGFKVVLRTDNAETLRIGGRREAIKRQTPVLAFSLRDGRYLGFYGRDGEARLARA